MGEEIAVVEKKHEPEVVPEPVAEPVAELVVPEPEVVPEPVAEPEAVYVPEPEPVYVPEPAVVETVTPEPEARPEPAYVAEYAEHIHEPEPYSYNDVASVDFTPGKKQSKFETLMTKEEMEDEQSSRASEY